MWHAGSETLVTDDDLLSTLDQYAFYGFCGLFGLIQIIFTLIVVLSVRPFILDYIYIVKPFSCFNIRITYIWPIHITARVHVCFIFKGSTRRYGVNKKLKNYHVRCNKKCVLISSHAFLFKKKKSCVNDIQSNQTLTHIFNFLQ